jgi:outer membrane protein TolC
LIGPGEVANARVFEAEQELAVLDREEDLDRASDHLATPLGRRPEGGHVRFRPAGNPPVAVPVPTVEEMLPEAMERSFEIVAARRERDAAQVLVRGAERDALPTLDLVGSLGARGLSGQGRDVVFGSDTLRVASDGGYGEALEEVGGGDFPSWSVGLELVIPLGFREARGERDMRRASLELAEAALVAVRRNLETRIRDAHRELVHGTRRLEAARRGVEASQEQVRIGNIDFRNGRSTAFELVRLGADLASAQRRYSQALVRTAKAAVELRHLTSGVYPGLGER